MSQILKIIANEGSSGITFNYFYENESYFDFDLFLTNSSMQFSEYYNFNILTAPYHYANFPPFSSTLFSGTTGNNAPGISWSHQTYLNPTSNIISASCFWNINSNAIDFILPSINNDGTIQGSSAAIIEGFPSGTNYNAGYLWYYASSNSTLSSHKIMPSIIWITGASYTSSNEGTTTSAATTKRVSTDVFSFLPEAKGIFSISNFNPLTVSLLGSVNVSTNYITPTFSNHWLDAYSYKSYNCYNGVVNTSADLNSEYAIGQLRRSYPIAASSSSAKGWHYVNNDFQHKWMGCNVSDNLLGFSIKPPAWINEHLAIPVFDGKKSQDLYAPLGNNNIVHTEELNGSSYDPITSSSSKFVYGDVFGIPRNYLYAPTILSTECFTPESLNSNLEFWASMSFPENSYQVDNSTQVLLGAYSNGTPDLSAPFVGEFSNTAISTSNIANAMTVLPALNTGLLGTGVWYKNLGSNTSLAPAANISIVSGNLRLKTNPDGIGKTSMTCLVSLYSSRSYRLFMKVSKLTENLESNNYIVRVWQGHDASISENLIHEESMGILDASFSFDTPPRAISPIGLGNKGYYRLEVVAINRRDHDANLYFDFMRFASNVTGITEESLDYIETKLDESLFHLDSAASFVSAVNSRVPFVFDTSLEKGDEIENSSIYTQGSNLVYSIASGGTGALSGNFARWTSSNNSSVSNIPLTTAGVNSLSQLTLPVGGGTLIFPDGGVIEDATESFDNGIISIGSSPAFSEFQARFHCKLFCTSPFFGKQVTLHLKNQSGAAVNDQYGSAISKTVTLPSSTTAFVTLDLNTDTQEWTTQTLTPTPVGSNTSLYFGLDIPANTNGGVIDFFEPDGGVVITYDPLLLIADTGQYINYVPVSDFVSPFFGNSTTDNSLQFHNVRRTRGIKLNNPSGRFSFVPLDYIPTDDQGFYKPHIPFLITGSLNIKGNDLSMYADTLSFKNEGYTNVNAKITELGFITNEKAFISRLGEGSSLSNNSLRYYYAPTTYSLDFKKPSAPIIKINVADFVSSSVSLIGTSPVITLGIQSNVVIAGQNASDKIIIWSGSNHIEIAANVQGSFVTSGLVLESEYIYIKAGTWNAVSNKAIDGLLGIDLKVLSINITAGALSSSVYTEPIEGQSFGFSVKSDSVGVVPLLTANYRYYIIASEDSSLNLVESVFTAGQVGNPSATSVDYDDSLANSVILTAWDSNTPATLGLNFTTLYSGWCLPSREALNLARAALASTLFHADNYTPPSNYSGHWTSSTGTSAPTTKMWTRKVQGGGDVLEQAYSATNLVRMIRVEDTSENFSVGDSALGGVIFKKEALSAPNQIIKIIKTSNTGAASPFAAAGSFAFSNSVAFLYPPLDFATQLSLNYLSQATSLTDGESNTQVLDTSLPSTNSTPNSYEVASALSDGYADWYIPSYSEWLSVYANLGVSNANLFDSNVAENLNAYHSSTIKITDVGAGLISVNSLSFRAYGDVSGSFDDNGIIGSSNADLQLRLVRAVTSNSSVSIGDTFQGGKVYSITPAFENFIPPSIEREFSVPDLLSNLSATIWSQIESAKIVITISSITSGTKVIVHSNLATPTNTSQSTPEGANINPYNYGVVTNITSAGIHTISTSGGIQSGTFLGYKLVFVNTTASNALNVDIESIKLELSHNATTSSASTASREEVTIDLYDEESFSSTYSCKDFEFLDKSSSDYSKTISVPSTKSNRNAFGSLSNPKGGNDSLLSAGVPINVYEGGSNIFEGLGFLQKSIYGDNENVESLELLLRGGNATWFTELSNLRLKEITSLSVLEDYHTQRAMTASELGDIMFPLVDTGKLSEDYQFGRPMLNQSTLTPAYKLKKVLSDIFKHIKYTVNSDFLNLQGDFNGIEFEDSFNGLFDSVIAVTSNPKNSEKLRENSKVMLSLSGQALPSRRSQQTNYGSTWAGNYDVNNAWLDGTPTLRIFGNDSTSLGRVALDYRPINFSSNVFETETSTSTVELTSSIYGDVDDYFTPKIGESTEGFDGNTKKTPLSWSPNVASSSITVARSGYYDISHNSLVSFYRDSFINFANGNSNSANDIVSGESTDSEDETRAGIGLFGKFSIVLVSKRAEQEGSYQDPRSMASLLLGRDAEGYSSIDITRTQEGKKVNSTQIQYLESGVTYYPVAILADKFSTPRANNQLEHWEGWDEDEDEGISGNGSNTAGLLISGGSVDYVSRHYFKINECNLTVVLNESPCPIVRWNAYYGVDSGSPKLSVSDLLPDLSALEFVSEISKLFNLVWSTNKSTRTIEVEPFNDFYDTDFSNSVDWTNKAYVVEQKINTILPKSVTYNHVEDSSDASLNFGHTVNDTSVKFGSINKSLNASSTKESVIDLKIFSTGKMAMNYGFISSVEYADNGDLITNQNHPVYCIRAFDKQNLSHYATNGSKPDSTNSFNQKLAITRGRMLMSEFMELNAVSNINAQAVFIRFQAPQYGSNNADISSSADIVLSTDTAYVYSSDYSTPTMTFSNASNSHSGVTDLNGGLYNKYHQRQIETLKFSDRMTIAEVNLTAEDINGLNFRKYVRINNDYYIINKVLNYTPNSKELTKVELILTHARGTQEKL